MSTTAGTIVIGYDGSASARLALDWAVDQAVAEHRPLTIAHGASPYDSMWQDTDGYDQRDGGPGKAQQSNVVDEACEAARRRAPELEVRTLMRAADPRDVLIDASHDAAVVVIGSRGRGPVKRLLLGSTSVGVTRHASCPVVVHRAQEWGSEARRGVMVGIDTREASAPVLDWAFRTASLREMPLTVVHAYWQVPLDVPPGMMMAPRPPDPEDELLAIAECVAGLQEKWPDVEVTTELVRGFADVALIGLSRDKELLVVGSHHGGAASEILFGSVAASAVEHARCPVAVVPTGPTG